MPPSGLDASRMEHRAGRFLALPALSVGRGLFYVGDHRAGPGATPHSPAKRSHDSFQRPKRERSCHHVALRPQSQSPRLGLSSSWGRGHPRSADHGEEADWKPEHLSGCRSPCPHPNTGRRGREGKGGVGTSVQACDPTCVLTGWWGGPAENTPTVSHRRNEDRASGRRAVCLLGDVAELRLPEEEGRGIGRHAF